MKNKEIKWDATVTETLEDVVLRLTKIEIEKFATLADEKLNNFFKEQDKLRKARDKEQKDFIARADEHSKQVSCYLRGFNSLLRKFLK